jgi:hypothetical protein
MPPSSRDALPRARVRTVAFERAMAEAFRQGNLGIMDYYRMKSVQADTDMQEAIAVGVVRRYGVAEVSVRLSTIDQTSG